MKFTEPHRIIKMKNENDYFATIIVECPVETYHLVVKMSRNEENRFSVYDIQLSNYERRTSPTRMQVKAMRDWVFSTYRNVPLVNFEIREI